MKHPHKFYCHVENVWFEADWLFDLEITCPSCGTVYKVEYDETLLGYACWTVNTRTPQMHDMR